jgi:hypothetical protein
MANFHPDCCYFPYIAYYIMENTPTVQEGTLAAKEETASRKKVLLSGIPEHILNNKLLADAIAILPPHYNF